jgi:hypothetical protein
MPACLQPSPSVTVLLSGMPGTPLCCLLQRLNVCTHRPFHQSFRQRRIAGTFSSIFLPPWSLRYPVGTGSRAILPSMAPNSRRLMNRRNFRHSDVCFRE